MKFAVTVPKLLVVFFLFGNLWGQTNTHNLAKRAAFIFNGEIVDARNLKQINFPLPVRSRVVRVVKVLYVKPTIAVRAGDLVVVQMAGETAPATGTRAIFYTNGWGYGKYLIVRELGHAAPSDTQQSDIARAKAEAEDDRVRERLDGAELVIAGKVNSTHAYEEARKFTPISEHDADWWIAEVQVTRFLKGKAVKDVVLVAFPNSRDVMWADSPKFKSGEEGIWILRRPRNIARIFQGIEAPVYTAINRRDFQEPKQADRIVRLLKTPTPNK